MTDGDSKKHENYFMQSLAKGIQVLETVADASRPMSLTEISRKTDLNIATTTRCCHTLQSLGFLQRDRQRHFHLTPKVLKFGYAKVSRIGWLKAAQYRMKTLSENIGETVNLSVLDGNEILYVARIKTVKILPFDLHIGSKLPLHCTSMGKVLAAYAPPDRIRKIIDSLDWEALTHRTITDKSAFEKELAQVKENGYAINDEELSIGLRSVAAPVLDEDGWGLAALNIAVPTQRASRRQLEMELAKLAIQTAHVISRDIQAMDRIEFAGQNLA
jgi:IclR family pca regulon transcriptional regulator